MATTPFFYNKPTQASIIYKRLTRDNIQDFTLKEIYTQFPFPNPSMRRAIAQAPKYFTRIKRGVYSVNQAERYRTCRHAKHIYDTHSEDPQNSWSSIDGALDCELLGEGLAPESATEDDIDRVVNPLLLQAGQQILVDNEIMVAVYELDFNVIGTELTEQFEPRYDMYWDIEVRFVNMQGRSYQWNGKFSVPLSAWE